VHVASSSHPALPSAHSSTSRVKKKSREAREEETKYQPSTVLTSSGDGEGVGDGVVGDGVGAGVGDSVGSGVGSKVGAAVGNGVGKAVVGIDVGNEVGAAVGDPVVVTPQSRSVMSALQDPSSLSG
jgi:hypothetical protein